MPPVEPIDAAPAADVTTAAPETAAPAAAPALSDDTLGALFDKINAAPEAPKDGDPADPANPDPADQPKDPVIEPAAVQAIEAPQSWSAEQKALWPTLSPDAQRIVADRESKAHGQISRMGQELSQLKPVGELRSQYQEVFDRNGVDFFDGFHTIMAMQNLLEKDPVKGLAAIAQTFDVDLAKAFGGQVQQQQAPAGDAQPQPVHPELSRLQNEINQLKGILTEQQRATIATQTAETRRLIEQSTQEIAKWSEGKAFHEELKDTMSELFKAGVADTLDEARELAIAKHPEIRKQIEASQEAEKTAKSRAEQEKAVAAAKRAAKTNGGSRPARAAPTGKWDDDGNLGAVYDEVSAQ